MLTVWTAKLAATPVVVGVVTGETVASAAGTPAADEALVEAQDADEAHDEAAIGVEVDTPSILFALGY